jgi:hypothetical protein
MKKITFWLFALFACVQIQAQVSLYTFAQGNETYSEITGGTVLGTATTTTSFDSQNWTIPAASIPFNFNFNGVDYTGCTVNGNGFITFGATAPTASSGSPISATTAYAGAISAWGGDLCGAFIASLITSETRWEVVGTAPNREFVIQFKNWRPTYSSSTTEVPFMNFQIRLAETTNQIKIVYGPNGYVIGSAAASGTRQIGIRGAAATDFKTRTNTTTQLFTASIAGTANSSSQAYNTSVATPGMPTNGLVYTYTPPVACTGTPVAGTVAPAVQNLCTGATPAALTLTGNSEGFTGLTFQWETSADNTTWANATGTSATTMVYSPPAFAGPTTVYYRCKITCTGSTLFSYSNVVTVNPAGTPVGQATGLNFTNIGYFGFTANWTNSDGNRRVVYISDTPIVDPVDGPGAALVAATAYTGTGQQVVYDNTGSSVTVSGLLPNTQYYVKVIQYLRCGSAAPFDFYFNATSVSNASTVTTNPPTAVPWTEGFATTTTPVNWVNTSFSISNTIAAINPALATNYVYRNSYTSSTTGNFVTPIFAAIPANYRFVFDYKNADFSSPYGPTPANSNNIVIAISTNNGTSYTDVVTVPNNGFAGWQTITQDLAAYVGQSIRIKVTTTWAAGDSYIAYDNFKIEAIPTCEAPLWSSLAATSVTASTATISWTASTSTPANGYDYYVSTTNTDPLSTVTPTGSVAAGIVTTNLTALTGNTTYYVWVRSNCATSDISTWSGPIAFKTLCTNVTAFVQNFDGVTSPAMPSCWDKVGTLGSCTTSTTTPVGSAPNVIYFYGTSTAAPTMRMQPVSNLGAGTHRLKFKMRSSSATTLPSIDFGYLTNPYDATTFVTLTSLATTGNTMVDYVYAPPAGTYSDYPAIKMNGSVYGTVYLDDFVWEPVPLCTDPSAIVFAQVAATTAVISWDAPATVPAVGYEYVVSTTNTPPTAAGTATTNTFASVSGLTPNAAQYVFVRSICSTTEASPWAGPVTFTTLCANVTAFTQNFDGVTASSLPSGMPACWTKLGTAGSCYTTTTTPTPSAPNVIYFYGSSTGAPTMRMQPVSNLGAGTHRLKFKMRSSSTTIFSTVEFGYLTDANDPSTFVALSSFTPAASTFADFVYAPPAGTYSDFPAMKHTGTVAGTLYFDDFVWEAIPTCPDPSALVSANVTSSSVDISWDAPNPAPALGYEYVISTTNTPPTAAGTAVTTTFASITSGLVPTTQYFVFVRAICSATDASPWAGPITFTTSCAPITVLPHVEPFATFLPSICWIKGDNGDLTAGPATFGTNSWKDDGFSNNGTTGSIAYNHYTSGANDWIISPQFTIPATGWELKFDAALTQWNGTTAPTTAWDADDRVEVLVASNLTNWTVLHTYNNANAPAAAGTPNIIDLDAYSGQTVRFAYRVVSGATDGSDDTDFFVDNFEIRLSPACPQPTNVVVSNVTATGAGSSWDVMAGAASGYEYVVSTSATPPTGAGTAVTTAFVALTGLTPQTPYYLYVRANCGSGSFSVWSVQTFTTQCAPVTALPWTEGFEGLTTFSSTDFPSCWYKQNGDWASRNTNDTYSTANTGTNFIRNSYNATNEFMWTPGFQLTAGTSYDFSSFIQGDNATTWVVDYFVNSNQNSTGATQLGASYNIPGTGTPYSAQPYTKITRSFVPTTSGVYYFAVRVNEPTFSPWYASFDDFELKVTPNIIPSCATGLTSVPNTTCGNFANQLSWTATQDATGYYVTIGTTSGGSDIANAVSVSATNYSFSGTVNTQYFWKVVPFSGAGSATGCTEQSFTTVATGCYCASVPTSNDGSGITNATVGTTPFVIADVMYVNNTATAVAVEPGTNTNVQLTFATGYTYDINVWIDFNNDFDFDDAGELVKTGIACTNVNPNTVDASFLMPLTAPTGAHRMRIGTADTGQVPPAPCYSGSYGVTLDFTVDTTLGSNSFDTSNFVAYPNPVKDVLNLSYKSEISNVKVINLLGQEVVNAKANTNDVQVDMSALNAGVYIVNVTVDDTVHSIKVIKE